MADHSLDDAEAPLDPAAERLRRKLARLLMVSGGFMMLGLIAVFAAIVYRLSGGGDAPQAAVAFPGGAPVEARLALPAGARLVAADLDGQRALLTLQMPEGVALLLVDLPSGRTVGRYELADEVKP